MYLRKLLVASKFVDLNLLVSTACDDKFTVLVLRVGHNVDARDHLLVHTLVHFAPRAVVVGVDCAIGASQETQSSFTHSDRWESEFDSRFS